MKSYQNDRYYEGFSSDQSNYKSHDDYSILEPAPDSYIPYLEDEDDEISDYSLMHNASDLDYEE